MLSRLQSRELHPVQANLLYVFMAAGMLLQTPLFRMIFGESYSLAQYYGFTIAMEVLVIGLPAFLLLRSRGQLTAVFSPRPRLFQVLLLPPLVIAGMITISLMTLLVTLAVEKLGGVPYLSSPPMPEVGNRPLTALVFVAVAVFPALCEEIAFRGLFYHAYQPYGRIGAAVTSGVLFALMHGSPMALPGHLALGIVLGLLAFWTGSIWIPILYHLLHNGLSILASFVSGGYGGQVDATAALQEMAHPLAVTGMLAVLTMFLAIYLGLLALIYVFSRRKAAISPLSSRLPLDPLWMLLLVPALGLLVYQYLRIWVYMFQ